MSDASSNGTTTGAGSDDGWLLGGRKLHSRLIIGSGKYRSDDEMRAAHRASGAEIVTVALRRVHREGAPSLLEAIEPGLGLLPNTAGCYTADDAVRTCRLARELCAGLAPSLALGGAADFVKLEVIGDARTLFPDAEQTLAAARILVKEGFKVLPYTNDDPIMARKLEDAGCVAVMPLAAPIGSGLGIRNPYNLRIILETVKVPVIVDAGVGTASDAAVAMELGCHAVLMNTAIAGATHAVLMAEAMREAVSAGRKAFLAGRIPRRLHASASSPEAGLLDPTPPAAATGAARPHG